MKKTLLLVLPNSLLFQYGPHLQFYKFFDGDHVSSATFRAQRSYQGIILSTDENSKMQKYTGRFIKKNKIGYHPDRGGHCIDKSQFMI